MVQPFGARGSPAHSLNGDDGALLSSTAPVANSLATASPSRRRWVWPIRRKPTLLHVAIIVFLDFLALTLAAALVQDVQVGFFNNGDRCLGKDSESPECRVALKKVQQLAGYLAMLGAGLSFLFTPALGALSDAYGRRKILIATELLMCTAYTLLAAHAWYGLSLWFYLFANVSNTAFSPLSFAFAYASDIVSPVKRAVAFAVLMGALDLGLILGPLIATHSGLDDGEVFLMASAAVFLCFLFVLTALPESLPREAQLQARRRIVAGAPVVPGVLVPPGAGVAAVEAAEAEESASYAAGADPTDVESDAAGLDLDVSLQASVSPAAILSLNPPTSALLPVVSLAPADAAMPTVNLQDEADTALLLAESDSACSPPDEPVPGVLRVVSILFLRNPFKPLAILGRTRLLRTLAAVAAMQFFHLLGVMSILYMYLHARFGMDRKEHGIMSAVSGACGFIVQTVFARLISRRFGNYRMMIFGLATFSASAALYALMWEMHPWLYFVLPVAALGTLTFPALSALKANSVGPSEQGAVQGALTGVRSLGSGVGPLVYNQLLSASQDSSFQQLPFVVGAVITALAVLVALTVPKQFTQDPGLTPQPWHTDKEEEARKHAHAQAQPDEPSAAANGTARRPRASSDYQRMEDDTEAGLPAA